MNETIRIRNRQAKPLAVLITAFFLLLVVVLIISKDMAQLREFISRSGRFGLLLSLIIYSLLAASPISSEPLTVMLSALFGPFNAMVVALSGNLLAAVVEYFIGGNIGDAANLVRNREKLPFGLGKFPVDSPIFLIAARFLPGYGPKFMSLVCGAYHVPFWRYLWTTFVANLPGSAIVAYGGFGLLHLRG